jgi:hypothetical protein
MCQPACPTSGTSSRSTEHTLSEWPRLGEGVGVARPLAMCEGRGGGRAEGWRHTLAHARRPHALTHLQSGARTFHIAGVP